MQCGVGVSCRILYSIVRYLYVGCSVSITSVGEALRKHAPNILQYLTALENDNFLIKNCDVFLIFALKHRLWVHVRTASVRRF